MTVNVVVAHTNPCARDELATPLRESGYDVVEAADFEAALRACLELEPDVALVGKCIESAAGGTLLDELKGDPEVFATAVVLVAPEGMPFSQARELLDRGAEDVLMEPVTAAEVLARVRAAYRTKTLQGELVGQGRRLETMLHEDPLTGLFNRRYVLTRLQGLISGARRHGRPLSIAMIDVDHFKQINDSYGHDAGDAALVELTSALRDRLRAEDELGRLGGEEFLALLPDTPATGRGVGGRGSAGRGREPDRDGQRRLGHLGRPRGRRRAHQTGRHSALPSQGCRAQRRAGGRGGLC